MAADYDRAIADYDQAIRFEPNYAAISASSSAAAMPRACRPCSGACPAERPRSASGVKVGRVIAQSCPLLGKPDIEPTWPQGRVFGASVLSASRLEPLAPFPLASPSRVSRSIREPG